MPPPDWFLDLCQKHLRPAAVRVGLALFRFGRRGVDTGGDPIIHGQLSLDQLEKQTFLSRTAVVRGLRELEDLADLVRHRAVAPSAPWGYALPLMKKATPVAKSYPEKSTTPTLDARDAGGSYMLLPHGGGEDIASDSSRGTSSSPPGVVKGAKKATPPGEPTPRDLRPQRSTTIPPSPPPPAFLGDQAPPALLEGLGSLGVADPQDFLGKFALEQVSAWVQWALAQPSGRFKNPAGYIYRKLEQGKEPPEVRPARDPAKGADPRDYTRGKSGWLVKY